MTVSGMGGDCRIRNRGGLKPGEMVPPNQIKLKELFKKAELKYVLGKDVVVGIDRNECG
jgi:hypothetical protein